MGVEVEGVFSWMGWLGMVYWFVVVAVVVPCGGLIDRWRVGWWAG